MTRAKRKAPTRTTQSPYPPRASSRCIIPSTADPTSTLPKFHYDVFDTSSGKHCVRLLKVLKTKIYGFLTCQIFATELPTAYTALSYEWGPVLQAEDANAIYVKSDTGKEGVLPVRQNLYDFLEAISSAGDAGDHLFWIDAICINQKNIHEKNHQVQQMGEIYKCARNVYIWLGNDIFIQQLLPVLHTKLGILRGNAHKFRRSGVLPKTIRGIIGSDAYAHLLHLFNHSYFRRLWIVQEIFLSREIVVICGNSRIQWRILGQFLEYFETAEPIANAAGQKTISELPSAGLSKLYWGRHKLRYEEANPHDLPTLLKLSKSALCSDTRDRIYGLLSLVPKANDSFQVDYNEELAALCVRALRLFDGYTLAERISHSLMLMGMLGARFEDVEKHLAHSRNSTSQPRQIVLRNLHLETMMPVPAPRTRTGGLTCPSCGSKYRLHKLATMPMVYVWCLNLYLLEGQHFDEKTYHVFFSSGTTPPTNGASNSGTPCRQLLGWGWVRDSISKGCLNTLKFEIENGLTATLAVEDSEEVLDSVYMSVEVFMEFLKQISYDDDDLHNYPSTS